jgi:ABC-type Zn uptake system ZnuABC Zn-binding protein ZnuA
MVDLYRERAGRRTGHVDVNLAAVGGHDGVELLEDALEVGQPAVLDKGLEKVASDAVGLVRGIGEEGVEALFLVRGAQRRVADKLAQLGGRRQGGADLLEVGLKGVEDVVALAGGRLIC